MASFRASVEFRQTGSTSVSVDSRSIFEPGTTRCSSRPIARRQMVNPKRIAVAWILTDMIWAAVYAVALRRHLRRRGATNP